MLVAPLPQALITVRTIGVFCLIRVYFDQTHPPSPQKFVAKKSRSEEGIWRFLDRPRQRHVWIGPHSTERHFRLKFSLIQWRVYQGQKDRPRASLAQPHSIWPAWSGSGVVTKTQPLGNGGLAQKRLVDRADLTLHHAQAREMGVKRLWHNRRIGPEQPPAVNGIDRLKGDARTCSSAKHIKGTLIENQHFGCHVNIGFARGRLAYIDTPQGHEWHDPRIARLPVHKPLPIGEGIAPQRLFSLEVSRTPGITRVVKKGPLQKDVANTSLLPSRCPPPVSQFRIHHLYLSQFMHVVPCANRSATRHAHRQLQCKQGFAEAPDRVGEDIHFTEFPVTASCARVTEIIETGAIYQPNGGSSL